MALPRTTMLQFLMQSGLGRRLPGYQNDDLLDIAMGGSPELQSMAEDVVPAQADFNQEVARPISPYENDQLRLSKAKYYGAMDAYPKDYAPPQPNPRAGLWAPLGQIATGLGVLGAGLAMKGNPAAVAGIGGFGMGAAKGFESGIEAANISNARADRLAELAAMNKQKADLLRLQAYREAVSQAQESSGAEFQANLATRRERISAAKGRLQVAQEAALKQGGLVADAATGELNRRNARTLTGMQVRAQNIRADIEKAEFDIQKDPARYAKSANEYFEVLGKKAATGGEALKLVTADVYNLNEDLRNDLVSMYEDNPTMFTDHPPANPTDQEISRIVLRKVAADRFAAQDALKEAQTEALKGRAEGKTGPTAWEVYKFNAAKEDTASATAQRTAEKAENKADKIVMEANKVFTKAQEDRVEQEEALQRSTDYLVLNGEILEAAYRKQGKTQQVKEILALMSMDELGALDPREREQEEDKLLQTAKRGKYSDNTMARLLNMVKLRRAGYR